MTTGAIIQNGRIIVPCKEDPVRRSEPNELLVSGMHGLGDNIHQRAVIREMMKQRRVWLRTPWPCVYYDMLGGDKLKIVNIESSLRTQAKNEQREADKFFKGESPEFGERMHISYSPMGIRKFGSVLASMADVCKVPGADDFRLPLLHTWRKEADDLIQSWGIHKPILLYRPLMDRKEWDACKTRNPDEKSYYSLFKAIRKDYFVISVADLEDGREWLLGKQPKADLEVHDGSLSFEVLAALTERASLVFTSPGFMAPLAQSVGTALVVVFGGFEDARSFKAGARWAPYLGIDPITPCLCFSADHACDKRIDMDRAKTRIVEFSRLALDRPMAAARLPQVRVPWGPITGIGPRTFMAKGEVETLISLARGVNAKTCIEFGVNVGRTAHALMSNVPTIQKYYGVDVPVDYVTVKECQRGEVPRDPGYMVKDDPRFKLLLRKRGSMDTKYTDFEPADFVFIDGDHSREGVIHDTQLAELLAKPGGVIVWHDYNDEGNVDVREVLNELCAQGKPIVHVTDTWIAFQRV